MDQQQPLMNPGPPVAPTPPPGGVFKTGIPSSVAFLVAILLFFMPFVDIKCNNMSLQTVKGVELATGFKMKSNDTFGDKTETKDSKSDDNKKPNMYALAAIILGVVGLLLSFVKAKAAISGALFSGILGAAALIGMMIDIKRQVKLDIPKGTGTSTDDFSKGISDMTDKMNISVDFTPWFYISVIAFLAAAFFCYKRMQSSRTP
jgi:hypothetical protein